MGNYRLEGNTYIIEDYDQLPPFSSFLPGLAGIKGIPMWVFYTNRGQGINSFGIHDKNNAIMEFHPANTAYENTTIKGFRTFMKCNGEFYEPFFTRGKQSKRTMFIHKNSFEIEDVNDDLKLRVRVKYFVLPEESLGALVRNVTIENIGLGDKTIELLDGMPKVIPYGIQNNEYKNMSNLLKSWSEIKNTYEHIPYYTMRSSSTDSEEVSYIEGGYFYTSIINGQTVPVIYDPEVVFDYDTTLINPIGFLDHNVSRLIDMPQYPINKIPCGFTPAHMILEPFQTQTITTYIGFAGSPEQIQEKLPFFSNMDYIRQKELRADDLVEDLIQDVKTHTAIPLFDQYVEQCYLDNFLRGGYPFVFQKGDKKSIVHLFSRKHGDPERDYNFFSIAGEYYSQGNGNFRDVNQNRRNDVFFHKDIEDFNIKTFFQLIQIDGYNPLEVRPSTFTVKSEHKEKVRELLSHHAKEDSEKLQNIVDKNFTPGLISNCIAKHHITLDCSEDELLLEVLDHCDQNIEAGFGEGYWSDHWDYNMDLVENYLSIYPDKELELLFEDCSYRYYDSPVRVVPRKEKYVIRNHVVRQYGAIVHDKEKVNRADFQKQGPNWLKNKDGSYVSTSLIVKMISLALIKFSTLDPLGMGVEMEGGKPGWNDAMNGLPGLLGSGMPETIELKRLIDFLCNALCKKDSVTMPTEIYEFLNQVGNVLRSAKQSNWDDFTYWDQVTTLREEFREKTNYHLEGTTCTVTTLEIQHLFKEFASKVEQGIQKAIFYGNGMIPTYFTYEAVDFEPILDEQGKPMMSHYGLPKAKVKRFQVHPVPLFLEGPAKLLGVLNSKEEASTVFTKVKNSQLYDKKLKMYKTSVPIEKISMEHGRIRAFTPGWLERESIFLHMEYKFLLSLIKAGLYDNFYEELKTTLIPFLHPNQYGRSILENSSFLASSENPDPSVHGRGFVARLSGSTTEMLSMWILMFIGEKIFTFDHNQLKLHFEPKLPGWLFDVNGEVSFRLFSSCTVTYKNAKRCSTYGEHGVKVVRIQIQDTAETIEGNVLSGHIANQVREGKIKQIIAFLD